MFDQEPPVEIIDVKQTLRFFFLEETFALNSCYTK